MAQWFMPLDPDCPEAEAFSTALLEDPMSDAMGAPVDEIMEGFARSHLGVCERCRLYGAANIAIRD